MLLSLDPNLEPRPLTIDTFNDISTLFHYMFFTDKNVVHDLFTDNKSFESQSNNVSAINFKRGKVILNKVFLSKRN